ncbi:hypothetical protein HGP16_25385 [Rhizobium sp. P40RR-XXII]|uniref:hypothetical protein n=1 Tax=Rhizobium sp. P40RR-XXII TaxID=2726739 RepID=UPI0014570B59|nr:hypothetical protein [Rhizobium sp. P40RR-XXII]NLS19876.1 hypothetical protein [Rhizobium sp. P40RR-XXII]
MATSESTKAINDKRQKLFAYYFRKELAEAIIQKESAARKTANRKVAKASDPTFTGQKFDHYIKAHLGEDDQKPVDRLRSDRENLEWLGLIPSTKGDLLAKVDRVDKEGMIRAKGYKAGLLGLDRVSGYDGGSADDKMFLESYDAGKKEYETDLPAILKQMEAETTKEAPPASGFDPFAMSQPTGKPN